MFRYLLKKLCNNLGTHRTKNEVSIEDFLRKCDQIRRFLRIWSRLLKKSLTENFIFCTVIQTVCYYHVTYKFQSESTLCSCLNDKELLARKRRHIRTHNHLFRERPLKHLTKLAKWLTVGLRIKWLWIRIPSPSLETQVWYSY